MEHTYINVLIADDEPIVRQGLKQIVDWSALGFSICGEAENGEEAAKKITVYRPQLILLDIRMPKLSGMELIARLRQDGYQGEIIILSGYSEFKYAQMALQYNVSYYLTKPIDEDELTAALLEVRAKISSRMHQELSMHQYVKKARNSVFMDLMLHADFDEAVPYEELGFLAPLYQLVIYERYTPFLSSYDFADLLRITNQKNDSFDDMRIENKDVILLKGNFAIEKLNSCLTHYEKGTEKDSPLDSIFLSYGKILHSLREVHDSYLECKKLMERRFFCAENQHVLSGYDLPQDFSSTFFANAENASTYAVFLSNYIKTYNRRLISQTLSDLKRELFICPDTVLSIKHFLADIFLQIKQEISACYCHVPIPFSPNALIIETIEGKYYLYEIFLYFTEQFEIILNAIGNNSSESVFDDILYYISQNYSDPLKLETIAPLFGYNSSYLGKLFSQKMNKSFHVYLDEVRIAHARELLSDTSLKVYEIASRAGYRSVDYFHQKFKRFTGLSPAEYRKAYSSSATSCGVKEKEGAKALDAQ